MSVETLLKLNVNEHIEKKNGLSYLSWAWAWAEALKADPNAIYKIEMYDEYGENGRRRTVPFMNINGTCMVLVTVTMFGKPMTCQLPVMDYRNKAIPKPDAFAVNTAIMRCMTKALSLHGLGLYIYAGEDIPEEPKVTPRANAGALVPDDEKEFLQDMAQQITSLVADGDSVGALNMVRAAGLEAEQHTYLWDQLDSKVRSAIKKAKEL